MSFNDLGTRSERPVNSSSSAAGAGPDGMITQVGEALQQYQASGNALKQKITALKRRGANDIDKSGIDMQVRSLRDTEAQIKQQIDSVMRRVDALPKTESLQKRVAVVKLQKDFERVKQGVQTVMRDASGLEVVREDIMQQQQSSANGPPSSMPVPGGLKLVQAMQGKEVDDAIMEERERDIKKINEDLLLVKEMFSDIAVLVDKQGEAVTEIAQATETSHERAKAGLEQVKQAAAYQPGCLIS